MQRIKHFDDELRGWEDKVTFDRYGFLKQDELGIHGFENGDEVAWLKDPNGNILSIAKLD